MKKFNKPIVSFVLLFLLFSNILSPIVYAEGRETSFEANISSESGEADAQSLNFVKSDSAPSPQSLDTVFFEDGGNRDDETISSPEFSDTDVVRVSIVLEDPSPVDMGFSLEGISDNTSAMRYSEKLNDKQQAIVEEIERSVLGGQSLDVVWNLNLVANIISANVEYGKVEAIRKIDGVKDVVLENEYVPEVISIDETNPLMSTSPSMIGSSVAYSKGYTGAGSRIAVIDTGIDTDHQSLTADGFEYSLKEQAERAGLETTGYVQSLHLLDEAELGGKLDKLHVSSFNIHPTAEQLYRSSKIPFAFNYVDGGLDVTHDNDDQGEHGSHVAGIAAANSYIPNSEYVDGYAPALEEVKVQGVAPDAQILVMKVFGKSGGTFESDYMAAIEDAIILGADSINLSLGSSVAGFSRNSTYKTLLDSLVNNISGSVVVIANGNNSYWAEHSQPGDLYEDDINFQTGGSPGSYTNSFAVASVDNIGYTGEYLMIGENMVFYTQSTGYSNKPLSSIPGSYSYVYLPDAGNEENDFDALGESILQGKIAICVRGETSFSQKANAAVKNGAAAVIVVNNEEEKVYMDLSEYTYDAPVVGISQEDGQFLQQNRIEFVGESESALRSGYYWTGSLEVCSGVASVTYDKPYQISSFSSWGVPGSLEMKPEITAPGGNIYSVNGAVEGGKAYENMSGTSMASPQVAGMAALLQSYIKQNQLDTRTGQNSRTLTQSLLMSTADPIRDSSTGYYYSILAQGAGLADIGKAIAAQSYILMDADATKSNNDGKVKVELGDDPSRSGEYEFGFTLYNLSEKENSFFLKTELFTQAILDGHLSTKTTPVSAEVTYTVDGENYIPVESDVDADVDQDGDTDAYDAQALLDYVVGNRAESELDLAAGDVDGDGDPTTYDAHLILEGLGTQVTLLKSGSVHITVHMRIAGSLDSYINGAYIEGFTTVESVASVEGGLDVNHSIPILGFYGNWTDPSMFDRVTYADNYYGETDRSYVGFTATNNLIWKNTTTGSSYYSLGNPYGKEPSGYPEGKAAINGENILSQYLYLLCRNAAAVAPVVWGEDGAVLYVGDPVEKYMRRIIILLVPSGEYTERVW